MEEFTMKLDANFFEKFEAIWKAVWEYIYAVLAKFEVDIFPAE